MAWFQSYDLSRVVFLVVDENEHMRTLIKDVLRTLGVETIVTAIDGESAIKAIDKEQSPDIILTGYAMEPMNGMDFVKAIRASAAGVEPTTPVVMMTSYTERRYVQEARDAGIDEFVAKPFSTKSLYTRIASIIQHRRPMIRAPEFFGPDRRRHAEVHHPQHRRSSDMTDDADMHPETIEADIGENAVPEEDGDDTAEQQPGFRTRRASSEPLDS